MRLRAGRADPAAMPEAQRRLAFWRGDPDRALDRCDRPVPRASHRTPRQQDCGASFLPALVGRVQHGHVGAGRLGAAPSGDGRTCRTRPCRGTRPCRWPRRRRTGRSGTATCSIVWLTVTPPDVVRSITRSAAASSLVNTYMRQRRGPVVDEPHGLVDVGDREHRQDRPEDLLLHHGRVRLHAGQHGRREVARRRGRRRRRSRRPRTRRPRSARSSRSKWRSSTIRP